MKFNCDKSALISTINIASRATLSKSAVPALEGILIEAYDDTVTVTGFDLKTGIKSTFSADVVQNGSIVLNSRLFGDIVRKLPDETVTIDVSESGVTNIKCGMSDFNIMGIAAEDYPELPSVEDTGAIYIAEGILRDMIAQTNFAVSDNETRPIHTGELFEVSGNILTVVAVDGFRLAVRREGIFKNEISDCSFVVPGNALSELGKILSDSEEMVRILPGAKHIMFLTGSTVVISRRLEGDFLDYRKALPKSGKYSVELTKQDMISSVERVSLIIDDRLKSPVRCKFSNGVVSISTTTSLGQAYDECPVTGSGEDLEIGFNNKYLTDALKSAPADNLKFILSSGVSPCVIVPVDDSDKFTYMILPVRLRANEG